MVVAAIDVRQCAEHDQARDEEGPRAVARNGKLEPNDSRLLR